MEQMSGFFGELLGNDGVHSRFLNSLSYLEYRGARKIARALQTEDIDDDVLTHAMEESRHALYFKKLAIKLGGNDYRFYRTNSLLAERAIKSYFYDLDQATEKIISQQMISDPIDGSRKKAVYYFVTWLIEERAMKLYQTYEAVLTKADHWISVKPVIADEDRHLQEVKRQTEKVTGLNFPDLLALEGQLFSQMWNEVQLDAAHLLHISA